MRRYRRELFLVALLLALVARVGLAGRARAADKTYYWDFIGVDIAAQQNGDMEIVETQRYVFTSGTFSYAYRDIPLNRVEGIDQVWVAEDGQRYPPEQVEVENTGQSLRITWHFSPTHDTSRTFQIHYVVHGGLRIYPDGDQLWWKAIFPDRDFVVRSASVTVHLPAPVATQDLKIATYGAEAAYKVVDAQTISFQGGPIDSGEELEVRVQFPHGLVSASPPAWQAAADRQAAYDERVRPTVNLLLVVFSLLLAVGGLLGVLLLWYLRGREQPVEPVAEYLSEPPTELSPGLAGVLLDEKADMRDIIATIVDLARRNIIQMQEQVEPGLFGIGQHRDFIFRLLQDAPQVQPFEAEILARFFGGRRERRLSDLKDRFYSSLPGIRRRMYEDAVKAGLFPRSPEATRIGYVLLGVALSILSVVGGAVGAGVLSAYTNVAFCPFSALFAVGLALAVVGNFMPRRTHEGAEQAARWRAFRRYLQHIEKYTDLNQAKEIFDRYLPYAIAFGLDREWIRKFAAVDAPAPGWWVPYPPVVYGGPGHHPAPGHAAPDLARAGGGSMPSLQGMSQGLAGSLQSMSDGLTAMLNTASSTLASAPRSSGGGGGWSGGGGGGGGGGGAG